MLNERLYRAVATLFGTTPHVINEGSRAEIVLPPPIISYMPCETPIQSRNIHGGEQYTVNCPFCGDTRSRLYISHMWNARLTVGHCTYVASDRLIRCFNEECQRVPENRKWLCENLNRLLGSAVPLDRGDLMAREETADLSQVKEQVPLPPHIADIKHPSVPEYIRHYWFDVRKFSYDTLRRYGVVIAYMPYPLQRGAPLMKQPVTIIPVFQYGEYWFFQARLIPIGGEPLNGYEKNQLNDSYPKYYIPHNAKKSWCLYNLDEAQKYEEIAIVEGVTDVWRIGDRAVAKFGRSISAAQRGILSRRFRGKTLILVPDSDDPLAFEEALKDKTILDNTRQFKAVKISRLPEGTDPGDLEEGDAWETIQKYIVSLDEISSGLAGLPAIQ